MDTFEIILSVLVGVGLSVACGFRVFVPLLVMSIAAGGTLDGWTPAIHAVLAMMAVHALT